MRILVIGAGATGGYFGVRLAQAGRDVTFLLRPARAAAVRANGIRLTGQGPDEVVPVTVVTAGEMDGPYDLVLLTVKNGALDSAMDDMAPAVAPPPSSCPSSMACRTWTGSTSASAPAPSSAGSSSSPPPSTPYR